MSIKTKDSPKENLQEFLFFIEFPRSILKEIAKPDAVSPWKGMGMKKSKLQTYSCLRWIKVLNFNSLKWSFYKASICASYLLFAFPDLLSLFLHPALCTLASDLYGLCWSPYHLVWPMGSPSSGGGKWGWGIIDSLPAGDHLRLTVSLDCQGCESWTMNSWQPSLYDFPTQFWQALPPLCCCSLNYYSVLYNSTPGQLNLVWND